MIVVDPMVEVGETVGLDIESTLTIPPHLHVRRINFPHTSLELMRLWGVHPLLIG
jgi:hypothetical protein